MNDREQQIVKHILRHCEEVMDTVKRFDASKENFKSDHVFYNAIVQENAISIFPPICVSTKREICSPLVKI